MLDNAIYFKNGKRAILLLHAYTGSPMDVRMLARRLERTGYTVLAPMFSGHGSNDPFDILDQSPTVWWEDAKAAVDFLKAEGFDEIAVFGLSMGGLFAVKMLEEYSEGLIGGGAFCSPLKPSSAHNILPNFMKYCEFLFNKQDLTPDQINMKLTKLERPLDQQLNSIHHVTESVYFQLDQLEYPLFFAQAGQDEMIDGDLVYDVGRKVAKSQHEIHWYPNSTHVITVSKDRRRFEEDVVNFIEGLPWNEEK